MPFRARWSGKCVRCGEQFDQGTPIRYSIGTQSSYVHADPCAPETVVTEMTPEQARAARCPSCFLLHAPGQKECW